MSGIKIAPITGLDKLAFALITQDDHSGLTYDTPVMLPYVKDIALKVTYKDFKYYADNKLYLTSKEIASIEVDGNLTGIKVEDYCKIMGHKTTSSGDEVIKTSKDKQAYLALMFRLEKDDQYEFHVLYKGKLNLGDITAKTAEDNKEGQPIPFSGVFQATEHGEGFIHSIKSSAVDLPSFFSSLTKPTIAPPSPEVA